MAKRQGGAVKKVRRAYFAVLPLVAPLVFATLSSDRSAPEPFDPGPLIRYDMPAETLPLASHSVYFPLRSGDTLDSVLLAAGLDRTASAAVIGGVSETIDPRRLREGQLIRVSYGAAGSVEAVEMKLTGWGVVRATRSGETFAVEAIAAPESVQERIVTGEITTSLYDALMATGEGPRLVEQLADVFQWDVDLFRLRRGDWFSLVVERKYVGEDAVGYGPILAARFHHDGRTYEAFYFDGGDLPGYYTRDGAPVRKQFLKAPLKYTRMTSGFTSKRFHPILRTFRAHPAIDYGAPVGTPVMTTADGVVTFAGFGRAEGNYIKIRHNARIETMYLHLSRFAKGVRKGAKVTQGEVIGYVGATGYATGPHLDYRVKENGQWLNPLKLKSITPDPLGGRLLASFRATVAERLPKLEDESRLAKNDATRHSIGGS